jgi:membrane protein
MLARVRALIENVLRRPLIRPIRAAYQRYYATGTHRTAGAAAYYGILTMLPFLGLFYLLLGNLAHSDPNFLRASRLALQSSLGLRPAVVASLYSAQGTASLRSALTLLGVIGLVYAGVNWMEAVEEGVWSVWSRPAISQWWRRYLRRWLTLLVTLPGMLLMVVVAVFVGRSPYLLLIDDGEHLTRVTVAVLEALALAATLVLGILLCYAAYRLIGTAPANGRVRLAALVAGGTIGIMTAVGAFLLPIALSNPYGIVVTILAVMLWVSGTVRAMLSMAWWAGADKS